MQGQKNIPVLTVSEGYMYGTRRANRCLLAPARPSAFPPARLASPTRKEATADTQRHEDHARDRT